MEIKKKQMAWLLLCARLYADHAGPRCAKFAEGEPQAKANFDHEVALLRLDRAIHEVTKIMGGKDVLGKALQEMENDGQIKEPTWPEKPTTETGKE